MVRLGSMRTVDGNYIRNTKHLLQRQILQTDFLREFLVGIRVKTDETHAKPARNSRHFLADSTSANEPHRLPFKTNPPKAVKRKRTGLLYSIHGLIHLASQI